MPTPSGTGLASNYSRLDRQCRPMMPGHLGAFVRRIILVLTGLLHAPAVARVHLARKLLADRTIGPVIAASV